jgi:photosystem I subunit 10
MPKIIFSNIQQTSGADQVLTSTLLAAVTAPLEWSPAVGITMIVANIIAIAFGKLTIKYPSVEPALPSPTFFGGFGLPAVLATTAFGHILGAGIILGLHNIGKL